MSKEGVRVALLTYSSTAKFDLSFRDGVSKKAVADAVKDITPREGGRRVDIALYQSVVDWRRGLPRNAVVFVDGSVTRNLAYLRQMIRYLNRRGLVINFIATSTVNRDFIEAVTAEKSKVHVLRPGENLNRYLHLVIPRQSKLGMDHEPFYFYFYVMFVSR